MAKIVDPDQLNQATEVTFDTSNKRIDLAIAGNLNDTAPGKSSGVTHQALYSFAKEEWLTDANLQKNRFPFLPIFEAKFDWINNWQPNNQQTIDLIRDGGFRVVLLNDEYAAILSLLSFDNPASDLAYYWQTTGWTATTDTFDKTGELNEPILIYDGTNNYRDFLKVALRVQGKTYGYGNLLVDQDLSALTYQAYRLPISNSPDSNITVSDGDIDTLTPYTNMRLNFLKGRGFTTYANNTVYAANSVVLDPARQSSGSSNGTWWFTVAGGTSNGANTAVDSGVTWVSYNGQQQIGTEWFAFNRIIDTSTGTATAAQFYNWGMRQLRKATNINANAIGGSTQGAFGNVNGSVAMELFDYIGSTLRTKPGVIIRNFDANDTNNLEFSDITKDTGGLDSDSVPNTSTIRTYPFVAAGQITFSTNLVDETNSDTLYKMFFQYSTRDSSATVAMAGVSGATGNLTSSGLNFTTHFANNNYVAISGFANANNNGLFQVTATPNSTNMAVRKVNGEVLVNAAASPTINLDADPYDTPDAIIVNNNAGSPITGQITAASVAFDFDYDGNSQGGRTAGTNAPIAIIAQGKSGAQWVDGLFTITRTTGLNFPLNAADERVYSNP